MKNSTPLAAAMEYLYKNSVRGAYIVASGMPLLLHAEAFSSPLKATDLRSFLVMILNSLIYIVFPIIVLMIVYTGFLFVTAQGNESKLSEARRALLWTVVGGLVVLGSVALALAIEATVESFKA
jgi:Type IV secretion system pilin